MDTYVIITSPSCKWCDKAKEALKERDISFYEFETTESPVRQMFFALWVKTVPQIFRAASGNRPVEYIGGYEDLMRTLHQDDFATLLNQN